MTHKRLNGVHGIRPRRKLPLAIGDVLFDLKGYAYRVVSRDEARAAHDAQQPAELWVRPVEEDPDHESVGLTRRQRQIARLLANRATNAEIASTLGISVHTARHHSQKVLEKLGISSRAQVRTRFAKTTREHESANHMRRDR